MANPKREKFEHPTLGVRPLADIRECKFDPEDLLTPKQFAKLVGVTESTLRTEHSRGYFKAAFCDPTGGRSRERRYTVQQIHLYRARRSTVEFVDDYTGAQAQQCFRAFSEKKGVRDCIEAFGIHPRTVEKIYEEWARCDECVLLTKEHLAAIREFPHDGPDRIQRGEEIVEILYNALEEARCCECAKRARKVCLACANKRRRLPPPAPVTEAKSAAE